jgi:hypothetical protein
MKNEKDDEDPCKGKPKEFFIYEYDEKAKVCKCKTEQLTFIAIHYPENFDEPIDLLMNLYDMAENRDDNK